MVATAAIGLWLTQSAFSTGPLHASLPAITGAEPLSGMTLGVLVFGDEVHITPWLLALQAAGLAAMVGGVILVARAPVFSQLRLRETAAHLAQEAKKITTGEIPLVRINTGEHAKISADQARRGPAGDSSRRSRYPAGSGHPGRPECPECPECPAEADRPHAGHGGAGLAILVSQSQANTASSVAGGRAHGASDAAAPRPRDGPRSRR